jgi:hypothetical protein
MHFAVPVRVSVLLFWSLFIDQQVHILLYCTTCTASPPSLTSLPFLSPELRMLMPISGQILPFVFCPRPCISAATAQLLAFRVDTHLESHPLAPFTARTVRKHLAQRNRAYLVEFPAFLSCSIIEFPESHSMPVFRLRLRDFTLLLQLIVSSFCSVLGSSRSVLLQIKKLLDLAAILRSPCWAAISSCTPTVQCIDPCIFRIAPRWPINISRSIISCMISALGLSLFLRGL